MTYKEKYEQLMESLVGDNAIERYTQEDILSYVYNLKDIEEKSYEKKKPIIDPITLDLINKLKAIQDTVNEGAWEYVHIGDILRLQDVFHTAITHFNLKKKGGIGEYGNDKGKYTEFWHSDYVCHTDPEAYDPSKVEEEDDE
jgi:hypothetical protein